MIECGSWASLAWLVLTDSAIATRLVVVVFLLTMTAAFGLSWVISSWRGNHRAINKSGEVTT